MMKEKTQSTVLPTNDKQQYTKPSFEVIDLKMESPLLVGSTDPTSINPLQRKND